ncbi:hypothetical protein [Alienimonas chondri]|uniref:Uncharacterized protein n=1 Tax=Alienimonas chondri TaxID=2681879 RepID=A0ABX1VJI7_9PLAN|nr:hypothetical protein [Alienimonas chondri]NNJ27937.1 hypothetical protein [Alienimonas chondri]
MALSAGVVIAGTLALMPAPPASEEFQVAFADWRRGGAWYVDDGGRAMPPAAAPGPRELEPSGPVMVAEAGSNHAEPTEAAPGPRFAVAPSNVGGRVADFAPAPLANPWRTAESGERSPRRPGSDLPDRSVFGPIVPPPTFADTPAQDISAQDMPSLAMPADADDASPLDDPAIDAEATSEAEEQRVREELLEELRGLRQDVRGLTERLSSLGETFGGDLGGEGEEPR